MTDLTSFYKTDLVDDHTAADVNNLIAAALRSEYKNVETLSADRELVDGDTPIQRFECGAADRVVVAPEADSVNNHPYWIVNASAAARSLTIKNAAGTVTISTLAQGKASLILPDGAGGYLISAPVANLAKASGAELDTGSDDAKFATAKAIKDAHNVPSVAPGTLGNVLTSDGTDWTSAAPTGGGSGGEWIAGTGTWSYSSADAPTFVISVNNDQTGIIGVGMRIKLTQTTVKYFIVTAVGAYSGGVTLITVYGGVDYTLANAAITTPFISGYKAPLGFPMSPIKWMVEIADTTERTLAGSVNGTWYNLGAISLSVPIGAWDLSYHAAISQNSIGNFDVQITLSTANNSENDTNFTNIYAPCAQYFIVPFFVVKNVVLTSKTSYYINTRTVSAGAPILVNPNSKAGLFIKAVCAYL